MSRFDLSSPIAGPLVLLAVSSLISLGAATTTGASPYRVTWHTIEAGGTCSGGEYVLTGTIGQPDADWSRADNYEVLGGFFPGGPLCFVGFDDFARFAQSWLSTGGGLAADLDNDNDVDFDDLQWLTAYWLFDCPYAWPLK